MATHKKRILELVYENNGIMTSAELSGLGYSRGNLKYLVDTGMLEKCARGVYILPELWEDELYNLQVRFKKGIFSHETALFLWGLTDRTPNKYHMTFPATYNLTGPKDENIRCSQCKADLHMVGVEKVKTPAGNIVNAYGMERTLCDILRPRSHTDIQIISESFKKYVMRPDRNIPLLSEYAKLFKVDQKVRTYLEVLL